MGRRVKTVEQQIFNKISGTQQAEALTHRIREDAHFRINIEQSVICVYIKLYFKTPITASLLFHIYIYIFIC